MLYKMAERRKRLASALAAMLKKQGARVAKSFEARMSAVLEEGEAMPDVAHLLDVLGRMLVHESKNLDAVENQRVREGTDLNLTRKELRQKVEPELRQRVIWVRDQMRNAYGAKEANRLLSHQGRTPRSLDGLEELAIVMTSRLPTLEPPKTKAGPPPNLAGWAEYVRPVLEEFRWHLNEVAGRGDDESLVVGARKEALADFDWTHRRVVRLTELFFELAGMGRSIDDLRHPRGRAAEQTTRRASGVA